MEKRKYSNDRIQLVATTIITTILKYFPEKYIEIIFGGMLSINDVVDMIILDIIKELYDMKEEKHSLRYFLKKKGIKTEDSIMRYSRIQSFIMQHRKQEYNNRSKEHNVTREMESLIPPDMTDMDNKLKGYKITEMNFFEITTILENEFTKALTEKRLIDSKKISNTAFKRIVAEYDSIIDNLEKTWESDTHNIIFNSIAAFTLEWKYPIKFLYQVAKKMEEKNKSEFDDEQRLLCALCGDIIHRSVLGLDFSTHSRMLHAREKYIDLIIDEPANSDYKIEQIGNYGEGLFIVTQMRKNPNIKINGESLIEWFEKNTDEKAWASFFQDYNVFKYINEKKEWTNKSIRYFRRLYSLILR